MDRRFRGSIYVDVWVPETKDLETDRLKAEEEIKDYQKRIPNSYIGGVAYYSPEHSLDREI